MKIGKNSILLEQSVVLIKIKANNYSKNQRLNVCSVCTSKIGKNIWFKLRKMQKRIKSKAFRAQSGIQFDMMSEGCLSCIRHLTVFSVQVLVW